MKTHEIKKLQLSKVEHAPYNPRTISDTAKSGLADSLHEFGLVEMPVVNAHGDKLRLIGGHRRFEQLLDDEVTHADCIVVDFDPTDEMAANLALNNPAIQGRFDPHKLDDKLLRELEAGLPKADFAGFDTLLEDLRAKHGYAETMRQDEATAAGDETPELTGGKVRSKVGTVYRLGEHRLFCGDFRDGVRALFPGRKKADVVITDPPYGEAYQARNGEEVEGDEVEPFKVRMIAWTKVILRKTSVVYMFCSSSRLGETAVIWDDPNVSIWQWLVWAKDRPTTQFPHYRGDYHHQCEFILFGGRGEQPPGVGDECTNVLEFPKPRQNELHPTQKPAALIRRLMEDSTEPGQLVFDPFAGSGTAIAVAQELERVCFACEIEPRHCDTIRKRWSEQVHGSEEVWTKKTPAVRVRR